MATVHHGWTLCFFVDEEVEIVPDQFHLAQSIVDAHWSSSVFFRTHNLPWALILNGLCVWVDQTVCTLLLTSIPSRRRHRKSARLNSSHVSTSYGVFCLKDK